MIVRITIGNLYSFNEETEISFVAGKSTAHGEQVSKADKRDDISVLKAGVIYGANASGKSNLIKAVALLKEIALRGVHRQRVSPFKLAASERPSKVEIELKAKGKYYAYGCEFTSRGIDEEWLYEINKRTETCVFKRTTNEEGNIFEFGRIKGDKDNGQLAKFIGQGTPRTDSFLSEYVKRNGKGMEAIGVVHAWMKNCLQIIYPETHILDLSLQVERNKEFAKATKALLDHFNTGIADIKRTRIEEKDVELPHQLISEITEGMEPNRGKIATTDRKTYYFETNQEGRTTIYEQKTTHLDAKGNSIVFNMEEESDGSLRLLDFIPMLLSFQRGEAVFLVDEIDRSMHPMMTQELLEGYFNQLTQGRDTQLICTTHESNLLDMNLLRADEVWFVEKDQLGASHLTSLAEYKPREDVRRGYLQGRYGAIPFFAKTKDLKWNER